MNERNCKTFERIQTLLYNRRGNSGDLNEGLAVIAQETMFHARREFDIAYVRHNVKHRP